MEMQNKLLISGAVLRPGGFELGEGKYYEKASLLRLDLQHGEFEEILSIEKANENYPVDHPNLEFTIGSVENNNIWLPTDTEIRLYRYPEMDLLRLFSHPCFHNIHSVTHRGEYLYVTSTGLDMVVVLDKTSGEIISYHNTEGKPTWHRFSLDVDYRKIHSTRPHDCHPNYVFWIDDKAWVTRCTQEDAICLTNVNERIDISGPDKKISVHDGFVYGDYIYFTSVDGCLIVADGQSQKVIETIELFRDKKYGGIRGWCRGLFINDGLCYIGFSRLRKTRAKGKLAWLDRFPLSATPDKSSSVIVFDLENKEIISDYHIPDNMMDAVYGILPEPGS